MPHLASFLASDAHDADGIGTFMASGPSRRLQAAFVAQGPEASQGASGSIALPKALRPIVKQVGDSLLLNPGSGNQVDKFEMLPHDSNQRFFCRYSHQMQRRFSLPDTEHPILKFEHPVKNVHITLTDLGSRRKKDNNIVWDADFATDEKPITEVSPSMPSTGGDVRKFRQLCYPENVPHRLELRVTADGAQESTIPKDLKPPFEPKHPDRGIDEIVQIEVKFAKEGDPELASNSESRPAAERARAMQPETMAFDRLGGPFLSQLPAEALLLASRAVATFPLKNRPRPSQKQIRERCQAFL
eukprot:TRINITY_DN6499_c2_g1_i2.p1 TRINITY_DN6499_c2_g1~~TRINITY_DN6499_c2_g1_i2.p1  ORF type:complete len:301 (+),score=46.31 TRINITY_DN6499_c2_g1_i2:80-982(+)